MRTLSLTVAVLLSAGLCLAEAPKPAPASQPAESAVKSGKPAKLGDTIKNSIGMKLTYIPAGDFVMGSPEAEANRGEDEAPHKVTFTQPILMATTAVTQKQWKAVMSLSQAEQRDEADPSSKLRGEGDDYPIYFVSWDDAVDFCRKLSLKERRLYRLPTEAEWEYACRAGTSTAFNTGDVIGTDMANYNGNFVYGNGAKGENRDQTMPVGSFKANAWGLFNMHGNVGSWCSDWYGDYPKSEVTDPQGAGSGDERVVRGGSWFGEPTACRSAARYHKPAEGRYNFIGLRVVTPVNAPPVRAAE